jgi:hypothetical protein
MPEVPPRSTAVRPARLAGSGDRTGAGAVLVAMFPPEINHLVVLDCTRGHPKVNRMV